MEPGHPVKYLIVRVNKFFPISKLWVCSLPQMVTLVTSAYLRNHTCRMHLLHLRSVKWGPPLSKVGTCSKFSLFRKRGIFRQLARFIYQPFNVRRPNLTLLRISHAFRNLL